MQYLSPSHRSPNPVDVPVVARRAALLWAGHADGLPWWKPDQVRIGVRDRETKAVRVGPVVLAINALSDSRLVVAYGPGSMWLYAAITTRGPLAVRVSQATGVIRCTNRSRCVPKPCRRDCRPGRVMDSGHRSGRCNEEDRGCTASMSTRVV